MMIKKVKNWFLNNYIILFSFISCIGLIVFLQLSYMLGNVIENNTNEGLEITSFLSSIIAGIVIAFLASKIIQIRQEKITLKPELLELTRKLHYFRKIVYEVANNYDFWPSEMPKYINLNYPNLTYYQVRDIIYVDKEITEEARKFIQDERFGEIKKQAYLEMKSFLLPVRIFDHTIFSEFDVNLMYSSSNLNKWQEYECGNMIWYLFESEYNLYEGQFNFNSFPFAKKKEIELLSRKIDNERYKEFEFGPSLLGKLGSQINLDIIPNLSKLQDTYEQGMPKILKFMYFILSSMLIFGVILPVIIKIFNVPIIFSFISIATVISLTVYFILRLPHLMRREIFINDGTYS